MQAQDFLQQINTAIHEADKPIGLFAKMKRFDENNFHIYSERKLVHPTKLNSSEIFILTFQAVDGFLFYIDLTYKIVDHASDSEWKVIDSTGKSFFYQGDFNAFGSDLKAFVRKYKSVRLERI
jgi:hypothetical protein